MRPDALGALLMGRRFRAYRALFGGIEPRSDAQRIVLADLKRFCCADRPTWDADPRVHALREGRREVWLRLQQFLDMPDHVVAGLEEVARDDR